ncbi:TRAP transporter large permease subunit [Lachnospiraceae bacterium 62-35]
MSFLLNSAFSTARVLIIISTATLFSFVVTYAGHPNMVLAGLGAIYVGSTTMLILPWESCLSWGCSLTSAIIMIAIPVFLLIVKQHGINVDVFGVLATMVCSLGCITPPFGTVM